MCLIVNCFRFKESNVIAAEWLFFPTSPVLSLMTKKSILGKDFFFFLKPVYKFCHCSEELLPGVQASKLIIARG